MGKAIPWTQEQVLYLKKYYPYKPTSDLCKFLNKNAHAINQYAGTRKIYKVVATRAKNNLMALFNESLESFYWLGMIAADGYVSKEGHLMLVQCLKQRRHLQKFANFISSKISIIKNQGINKTDSCRVNAMNGKEALKIRSLFGTITQKTYDPLNIAWLKKDSHFLAFLIGFIDGDGTIRKGGYIRIQCHGNMLQTFTKMNERIFKIFKEYGKVFMGNRENKYATFDLNKRKIVIGIKKFALINDLPIKNYKWNRIKL